MKRECGNTHDWFVFLGVKHFPICEDLYMTLIWYNVWNIFMDHCVMAINK